MNKLLAAAVAIAALGLPGPALAQHMDITEIIAGIGGTDFQTSVERLETASAARVVRLSTLAGAAQATDRVAGVYDFKTHELNYLHTNLILNPIAVSAVRNAGVSINQIVSVSVPSDGAAVLFADDL